MVRDKVPLLLLQQFLAYLVSYYVNSHSSTGSVTRKSHHLTLVETSMLTLMQKMMMMMDLSPLTMRM